MSSTPVNGPELLRALESVRAFHGEVARLLRASDAYLAGECGWRVLGQSQCLTDLTYSVHNPDKWLPAFASRFFAVKDHDKVGHVTVLMGKLQGDTLVTPLTQPLVYAGWAVYEDKVSQRFQSRWLAKTWYWMEPANYRPFAGTRVGFRAGPQHGLPAKVSDGVQLAQGCVEPVPLVEITSADVLVERVMAPFVDAVGATTKFVPHTLPAT